MRLGKVVAPTVERAVRMQNHCALVQVNIGAHISPIVILEKHKKKSLADAAVQVATNGGGHTYEICQALVFEGCQALGPISESATLHHMPCKPQNPQP